MFFSSQTDAIHYRRVCPVTLIEVLIVICILGLFLGLIGFNVNRAVHEQQFRSEVGTAVEMLRVAQMIMLVLDNDVHVKVRQEEDSIHMWMETACPLSKKWKKWILTPKVFHTIHIVRFKDHATDAKPSSGELDIRFLSNGYAMSQGIIQLATADAEGGKKGLQSFICLPGYPAHIATVSERPSEPDCYEFSKESELLTQQIVNEIRELETAQKKGNAE